MSLMALAVRNVFRNKFRTSLTILGVAFALVCFLLLRTVIGAWTVAVEHGAQDRIATRHKVTFVMTLPHRYYEEIKQVEGVSAATFANWTGHKDPTREDAFFAALAVETDSFFDVYDEYEIPADQLAAWKADRQGAIVGHQLAAKMGYDIGDRVTMQGTIFPGDWEFNISGIYTSEAKAVDRSQFLFHWKYHNESVPEPMKEQVGWVVSRVDDIAAGPTVSEAVDARFDDRDLQTETMSERAMNMQFLGAFSAILDAIQIVSIVVLVILMLILGNTMAMGVRERTHEYGVLRAIGFRPKHIASFVLGEAVSIGVLGGGLGLLLSYPLVEHGLGRFLEENMGSYFPYFRIPPESSAAALGLAIALGLAAAALPAYRASKLKVVDALRRIG